LRRIVVRDIFLSLLSGTFLLTLSSPGGRAEEPSSQSPAASAQAIGPAFGFSGLEMFKVDEGTSRLRCLDVNGDGLTDVALVNNSRATIDFFLQKTAQELATSETKPVEYDNINEIASDARFKKDSFLTEKRVFDILLEDLNGDGRPDLAYYGDPKELVVVLRTPAGWSETRQRFQVADARAFGRGLAAGDLNGDGRQDLALLGAEKTYLFSGGPEGKLAEPTEIQNSEKSFTSLFIADLDGDGRKDLLLAGASLVEPFHVRFQGQSGLGPEIAVETPTFRSVLLSNLTGDERPEISVVQEATGRLVVFQLEAAKPEGPIPLGKIRLFPLTPGEDSPRQRIAIGDVDGDRLADVLETSPGSAQFGLYRQGQGGDLQSPMTFPALAGSAGTRTGDIDGDQKPEVIVLSSEEKAIGVTRWDGARLAFPRSVPLTGKPVACDLANLNGEKGEELAVAVEDDGKTSIHWFAAGEPLSPLGEPMPLENAKDPPERIVFFDANQDGRADLLTFFPYEPVRVYIQSAKEEGPLPRFTDVSKQKDFGRGLLQGAVQTSFASGDLDGDGKAEFFLAKKNFARAFRVTPANVLEVVDQFNARDPQAEIVGVATADLNGDGRVEVILLDKMRSQLWILTRQSKGTYDVSSEIKIPAFRYRGLAVADLNGDGRNDLFVNGDDRFGVLYFGGTDYRLKRLAQYETELKGAWLDQTAAGDLNGDGRKEILVTELSLHLLEVLVQKPSQTEGQGEGKNQIEQLLDRKTRFKVFEDRARGDEGEKKAIREPRELAIADVTGDGKADVILLVHDRIVLYPQE
jgi:hypothetical protein